MNTRAQQVEAITDSLTEPIANALILNSPEGADITDILADVRENISEHLTALSERNQMAQLMTPAREPKTPSVDMIGTYSVPEPVKRVNPKDGQTYEVPRGEYPVMGLLSSDRKQVNAAAIILSAPNTRTGELMDIVQQVRPVDVPAMVQRREIAMETRHDKSLKFPLSMFTAGDAPQKKHAVAQAPEQQQEHRLRVARSA